MTLKTFINEKLCPTGVVTVWDADVIATAFRLGDIETLTSKVTELAAKAGIEVPADLTLKMT